MNKDYDLIIYIGRFQPLHNAHVATIEHAKTLANEVLVVVGSANEPRTFKNPWTQHERMEMIHSVFPGIHTDYIENQPDDDVWAGEMQRLAAKYCQDDKRIAVIGYEKDHSSRYLRFFPQWTYIPYHDIVVLDATKIREIYFSPTANMLFQGAVPVEVFNWMYSWADAPNDTSSSSVEYQAVREEFEMTTNYKKQFAGLRFPPFFVTADAVVVASGHILLIKRGRVPGKGLWALPGGFVKPNQTIKQAMLAELKEETSIGLPDAVLLRNITQTAVIDDPDRDPRGRIITHAFKISLTNGEWNLPNIQGGDDAAHAEWVPIVDLRRNMFYADHYNIIQMFLGGLKNAT